MPTELRPADRQCGEIGPERIDFERSLIWARAVLCVPTWPVFFEHFCGTPEHRARTIETFTPGNPGHARWSELDVVQQDSGVFEMCASHAP
jgi:hypothetical protein